MLNGMFILFLQQGKMISSGIDTRSVACSNKEIKLFTPRSLETALRSRKILSGNDAVFIYWSLNMEIVLRY